MNSIQYTIRNIPSEVDSSLRQRAKKNKQSFNATVISALKSATQQSGSDVKNNIDWFYGSGGIGSSELKAFKDQRAIDTSAWEN